ncbi:MAG: AtpZ/AtpI family protein [Gemmatimonadaceae bacterium]
MTPDDERRPSRREPERAPNGAREEGPSGHVPGGSADGGGAARRRAPGGGATGGELTLGGLEFAATFLVFLFLGRWLDGRLGTTPWLTMIFLFVGAGGAFYSMYRRLTAAQKRARDEKREGR